MSLPLCRTVMLCYLNSAGCLYLGVAVRCVKSLERYQFFFFSSRRRHTRCSRDWSSDVCSSDLIVEGLGADIVDVNMGCPVPKIAKHNAGCSLMREPEHAASVIRAMTRNVRIPVKIGRASCRERV